MRSPVIKRNFSLRNMKSSYLDTQNTSEMNPDQSLDHNLAHTSSPSNTHLRWSMMTNSLDSELFNSTSDLSWVYIKEANTMYPDQTAPTKGAVWSGSVLFAV